MIFYGKLADCCCIHGGRCRIVSKYSVFICDVSRFAFPVSQLSTSFSVNHFVVDQHCFVNILAEGKLLAVLCLGSIYKSLW